MCLIRDSVQASHRPQGGPLKTALQVRCKKNRRMPMAPAANVAVPTWWQRATYDASGSQRNLQTSDGYGCLIRNEAEVFNGVILHFSHPVSRAFLFQRLTDLKLSTVDQGWCMLWSTYYLYSVYLHFPGECWMDEKVSRYNIPEHSNNTVWNVLVCIVHMLCYIYIYFYTYGTAPCTYHISEDPGVTFWILFGITGLEWRHSTDS